VSVPPGTTRRLPVERPRHAFAYVFEGDGRFLDAFDPRPVKTELVDDTGSPGVETVGNRSLVLFDGGDEIVVRGGELGVRFLLVSGMPLGEPVAWRGPIVMNIQDELHQAFSELQNGTFIR
jgi:hypothetical protein